MDNQILKGIRVPQILSWKTESFQQMLSPLLHFFCVQVSGSENIFENSPHPQLLITEKQLQVCSYFQRLLQRLGKTRPFSLETDRMSHGESRKYLWDWEWNSAISSYFLVPREIFLPQKEGFPIFRHLACSIIKLWVEIFSQSSWEGFSKRYK